MEARELTGTPPPARPMEEAGEGSLLLLLLRRRRCSLLSCLGFLLSLSLLTPQTKAIVATHEVCIVGSGIAGSSLAHFLSVYRGGDLTDVVVLERNSKVGGRMATVTLGGDTFESGGTILHPKNLHVANFTSLLGLHRNVPSSDSTWFGIWNGSRFVFQTLPPLPPSSWAVSRFFHSLLNSFLVFKRYGFSLLKMNNFVKELLEMFLRYYEGVERRPVFESVEEMLEWSGLYRLTQRTLEDELKDRGLSPLLISELITVIMRVNYGQDVTISGLAGAVSLAGSDDGLWGVVEGNWQIAAGLLKLSNVSLHLEEALTAISYADGRYKLTSAKGNIYNCRVAVIAAPLDEQNINFTPSISIPSRKMQHTHATFVRGLLNPAYFGLESHSDIPELVGTVETPSIPFSSINVLKKYSEDDKAYKVFSRTSLDDDLLDTIFSIRRETTRIDWAAYPHYNAPEVFAPLLLDGNHLYYINSFENAASTIETSAVAAENVARLILSRLKDFSPNAYNLRARAFSNDHLQVEL